MKVGHMLVHLPAAEGAKLLPHRAYQKDPGLPAGEAKRDGKMAVNFFLLPLDQG